MKARFIKTLSILLVIASVLTIPSFALEVNPDVVDYANAIVETVLDESFPEEATEEEQEENSEQEEQDEIEEPAQKLDFNSIPDDTIVGRMYICSQIRGLGHAWIYIESTFNGDMPVGCYTLEPYEGVSVGSFALSRSDGAGVYYNVETYCAQQWGLKRQAHLGMDITKKQLLKVSKRIKQWNYWDLYFNCTFFAAEIWNCVSPKKMIPILFPFVIKWQILMRKDSIKSIDFKPIEASDCYKQKGLNKNARLEPVSPRTLDSPLG